MLKRAISVGVALTCALFMSVSALAYTSNVSMDFPLFSSVDLYQGSSQIYAGTVGSLPISGIQANTNPSSVYDSIQLQLKLGGSFSVCNTESAGSFSYSVPYISDFDFDMDAFNASTAISSYIWYYDDSTGRIASPSQHDTIAVPSVDFDSTITYRYDTFTADISHSDNVNITNTQVAGGDYFVSGYFHFATGVDLSSFENSTFYIRTNNMQTPCPVNSILYSKESHSGADFIFYSVSFNVPTTGYQDAVYLNWSDLDISLPIVAFGISTGGVQISSDVTGIAGLTMQLGSWISGIKSSINAGFERISYLLDRDHEKAAESADRQAVSEASSSIQEIHQFEGNLNSNITSGIQQIDFTLPSSSGFIAALGAISYVFGLVFNSLGSYQFIITIPMILGILLLLLGRGMSSLGEYHDNQVRAVRRERRYGGH